jgi:hypothetical protein
MNKCNGITIVDSTGTLAGDPAECDTSTIDKDNALTYGTTGAGQPFGCCVTLRNAAPTANWRLELDTNMHNMGPIDHPHSMNDNMPMPANENTRLANVVPINFNLRAMR